MERGVDLQAIDHLSPVWTHLSDIIVKKGDGCYLFGADGNRYLDFTSGYGVTNTGHCHPRVVHAIQDQAAKLIHGQVNIVFSPAVLNFVSQLRGVVPPELDGFFFSNRSAEAVEAAAKLARHATGRLNPLSIRVLDRKQPN